MRVGAGGAATPVPTGSALEPVRDPQASVTDLLDVLLDKGVVLNLDLLISVADIPLIGVSVKAALAGIETMLEFGMMRGWDERTREWVQRSLTRQVPLAENETLILRMAGSCFEPEPWPVWRPGTIYLTDRRILVYRREPPAMLFVERLPNIERVHVVRAPSAGDTQRLEIRIVRKEATEARLTAEDPQRLVRRIRSPAAGQDAAPAGGPLIEGELWYEEPRARGAVWRAGHAVLDVVGGLKWRSTLDRRPAVSILGADVRTVRIEERHTPHGQAALVIDTTRGETVFAGARIDAWLDALRRWRRIGRDINGYRR